MARRQLVSGNEATPATKQHTKPCGDCPWRKDALPGWLGNMSVDQWLQAAHIETLIDCHTKIGPQCAGAAIYRRNVCKMTHTPAIIRLEPDREKVFTTPMAFKAHHAAAALKPVEDDAQECEICGEDHYKTEPQARLLSCASCGRLGYDTCCIPGGRGTECVECEGQ